MLKARLLPALAVLGGMVGFFLRRRELATAFEDTGLAAPFAPASVALIALSAAIMLALALLCRGAKNRPDTYDGAFFAAGGRMCLVVSVLAAACLLVAALTGLRSELTAWPRSILRILLWLLCAVSFFCVIATAWSNYRAVSRRYRVSLLIPGYMSCLWLVSVYQKHAADPVVLNYVYALLAIICTLLGIYFAAAFSFSKGKVWRCAFFQLAGIYFSIVTLADSHDRAMQLLYLYAILYQLPSAAVFLKNTFATVSKEPEPIENNTQEVTPDE